MTTGAIYMGGELTELDRTVLIDLNSIRNCTLPKYPIALRGATGVLANDMILICGGGYFTEGFFPRLECISDCYKLYKGRKTFDAFNSMSEKRCYASSTVVHDQLVWITGGCLKNFGNGLITTDITNSSAMFSGVNLPKPNNKHVIIMLNDTTALLIGGFWLQNGNNETY